MEAFQLIFDEFYPGLYLDRQSVLLPFVDSLDTEVSMADKPKMRKIPPNCEDSPIFQKK